MRIEKKLKFLEKLVREKREVLDIDMVYTWPSYLP